MKAESVVRAELLALLDGVNAHMSFDEAVADFPLEHINTKPPHSPYSFWHFIEHIRIAQWDILQFIVNPEHQSPHYPEGYRPPPEKRTSENGWWQSIEGFRRDVNELKSLVMDRNADLFAPIPHAPDYTIFREVLLATDHNSYHIGELAILRQIMDIWPASRRYLTGRPD